MYGASHLFSAEIFLLYVGVGVPGGAHPLSGGKGEQAWHPRGQGGGRKGPKLPREARSTGRKSSDWCSKMRPLSYPDNVMCKNKT